MLAMLAFAAERAWTHKRVLAVEVWRSPDCNCCRAWIHHFAAAGVGARIHDTGNTAARHRLGIPLEFGSCHTALIEGYAIEGHVPAREIRRLLAVRPNAIGLAVPRMPVGSPGTDGPVYGGRRDPFDVMLIDRGGRASVLARYPG